MSITGLPSASIQNRTDAMRMYGSLHASADTTADVVRWQVTGFSGWSISSGTY
ncbi:hypothetical protein ACEQ38_23555 [Ralstonia syzygii subsp. celebesensis]|uniref:hypothetical protein n=1 Tax=Ralstonia syzygii TaxID=28097 RepID=UPI0012FE1802|nr:hypothetical protein [Ralstonia syzygii]QQV58083.1 hypothetical protein JK151_22220 [Ralstonia syzygii subsp. celebesensis]